MMTDLLSDTPSLSNEWDPCSDLLEASFHQMKCSLCFGPIWTDTCSQRCCWRCHGCQHCSPRSAEDGPHSRRPCPRYPWGGQGLRQVCFSSCMLCFCKHRWWYLGSLYWILMWKSAIVTQVLSEMYFFFSLHSVFGKQVFWKHLLVSCRRQAHLCALAANCDEPMYVKLVEALCAEHQINLIKVNKLQRWGCITDDNLAPSTDYCEESATVTQVCLRCTIPLLWFKTWSVF